MTDACPSHHLVNITTVQVASMCQSNLWQVRACNGAAGVVGLKCWANCRDSVQPKQFRTDKEVIENEMLRPWLLDVDLSIFGNGSWDAAFTLGKAVLMVSKTADSELVNEVLVLRTSGKFAKVQKVQRPRLERTQEQQAPGVRTCLFFQFSLS